MKYLKHKVLCDLMKMLTYEGFVYLFDFARKFN